MDRYDLLIVADATASMRNYLTSLNTSLPQIISISALTGCFSRVGFSGWLDLAHAEDPVEQPDIVAFAKSLKPKGGGDYPEATKTALAKAYAEMRPDAKTIILPYTDAPPHEAVPTPKPLTNADAEIKALSDPQSYNGFGPSFLDWVSAAKTMGHGEKQAQVFTLLEWDILPGSVAYYIFLCTMTDGACICLDDSEPGAGMDEGDKKTQRFFPVPYNRRTRVLDNINKKPTPARNPTELWDTDSTYRKEDICAIAVNAVFGGLWRVICKDRTYAGRDDLVNAFSQAVGGIRDQQQKEVMERWLDESYNFPAEIQAIVDDVSGAEQFPCVEGELLEISRSCDPRILGRLGRVLTRLTHRFWKILLHTIVPGTQLMPRAAALLAALTIRLGIPFLTDENCLTLLQEANANEANKDASLLKESDIRLFERLVSFKKLEHNPDTPLMARIAWTPRDAVCPIGFLVTSMRPSNPDQKRIDIGVSSAVTAESNATWVECEMSPCRAQYIVYDAESRRVHPKCHYCRDYSAPVVDCSRCASRIIWPEEYRPCTFDASQFVCPGCESGRETSEEFETSASSLAIENTKSWLAEDSNQPGKSPFTNRSPFYTVSTMGTDEFMRRISLFPVRDKALTQQGKTIRNTHQIISTLNDFVAGWKATRVHCSLCFSPFWPAALNPACGRRGCLQRICTSCAGAWYGSNASGSIINTAAVACPFCRRLPAPGTLAKYGRGIHAVKDLNRAIENHGTWIYAWCSECSSAKEFMERDCARGRPAELIGWTCDSCEELARQDEEKDDARVSKTKPCPNCETMTEKTSGCGHIVCPVDGCGTHWCYFCGEEVAEQQIYIHMTETHGWIYDQDELDGYDSDDSDGPDDFIGNDDDADE
ncbi:hypothetical protein BDW62DRAFT_212749 [Aspergillus aurantiobrunneus]